MYEYTVIFTNNTGKFAILIKYAQSSEDAIQQAIEYVKANGYTFSAVEAVQVI